MRENKKTNRARVQRIKSKYSVKRYVTGKQKEDVFTVQETVSKPAIDYSMEMNREEVISTLALQIHSTIIRNDRRKTTFSTPTLFDSPAPNMTIPSVEEIRTLYSTIMTRRRLAPESGVMSLVLLERTRIKITSRNWDRLVMTSLLLANKEAEDVYSVWNVRFVGFIPGLQVYEINFLEMEFLQYIEYRLHVEQSHYKEYYSKLIQILPERIPEIEEFDEQEYEEEPEEVQEFDEQEEEELEQVEEFDEQEEEEEELEEEELEEVGELDEQEEEEEELEEVQEFDEEELETVHEFDEEEEELEEVQEFDEEELETDEFDEQEEEDQSDEEEFDESDETDNFEDNQLDEEELHQVYDENEIEEYGNDDLENFEEEYEDLEEEENDEDNDNDNDEYEMEQYSYPFSLWGMHATQMTVNVR
jgi:hypothetical protein